MKKINFLLIIILLAACNKPKSFSNLQFEKLEKFKDDLTTSNPLLKCNEYEIQISYKGDTIVGIGMQSMGLKTIPNSICDLEYLETIYLTGNSLDTLPDLSSLKKLKSLYLTGNKFTHIPYFVNTTLRNIDIGINKIDFFDLNKFPESIKDIDVSQNNIRTILIGDVNKHPYLGNIVLWKNNIKQLPKDLFLLYRLRLLQIDGNKIEQIDSTDINLSYLRIDKETFEKNKSLFSNVESIDTVTER